MPMLSHNCCIPRMIPDGTVVWTLPGGRRHAALLFPRLCLPTGELTPQ